MQPIVFIEACKKGMEMLTPKLLTSIARNDHYAKNASELFTELYWKTSFERLTNYF